MFYNLHCPHVPAAAHMQLTRLRTVPLYCSVQKSKSPPVPPSLSLYLYEPKAIYRGKKLGNCMVVQAAKFDFKSTRLRRFESCMATFYYTVPPAGRCSVVPGRYLCGRTTLAVPPRYHEPYYRTATTYYRGLPHSTPRCPDGTEMIGGTTEVPRRYHDGSTSSTAVRWRVVPPQYHVLPLATSRYRGVPRGSPRGSRK
jgi:hypothetical protein